jgi:hypothetical protein
VGGSDSYPAVAVEKADPLRSPPCDLGSSGRSVYLDFLAGFCLLDFRGTTALATNPRASALVLRLAFGFLLITEEATFLGVRILAVSFLALDCASIRDFNVPFMPAWAIDNAFCKSSRIFFTAMPHHAIAESGSH